MRRCSSIESSRYRDLLKTMLFKARFLITRSVFCVFLSMGSAQDPGFLGHADVVV